MGGDLAALRSKTMAEIMKLSGGVDFAGDKADRGEAFMPAVDGKVLPDDPARLYLTGKFQHVALIAGTNADEGTLMGGPPVKNVAQFKDWLVKQFGERAGDALKIYAVNSDAEAHDVAAHVSGDWVFLQGIRSVLRAVSKVNPNTYQYQFTRVSGVGKRINWGAFHASSRSPWWRLGQLIPRLLTKGPRSLTVTTTLLSLAMLVSLSFVPKR
jgi:carboxylesterase type B